MKAASFLPPIVLEMDRDKPWMEWVPGTVLFSDVSGFTPMSEALSVLGAEGGEILTDVLNRYFTAMIGIIHANGGQVMKFGGDAILCFFPGTGTLSSALRAARLMQTEMPRFRNIKTPVKRFALKMKIGVAHGECLLAGVGDPALRCDYVFAGSPVDATSDAEHHAAAGEVIFAGSARILAETDYLYEEVESGFYRILATVQEDVPLEQTRPDLVRGTRTVKQSDVSIETAAAPYLIRAIHAMVTEGFAGQVGALLDIVPVFLKFSGFAYTRESFDLGRFDAWFRAVMEATGRYGGHLNRISMGDKGSTFFILFGAPSPLEKKEELACQWALDLQALLADFPEVTLGIGMNAGRVFSGTVGGSGRMEYTVMGDAVNFSARLMQGAKDRQVCVSESVRDRAGERYSFVDLGKRRFKGKAEPLSVFSLQGRGGERTDNRPSERMVGRTRERELILQRLQEAAEGKPGMVVIEGEPGTGKSFLADHILKEAEDQGWRIIKGHGEITLRNHPYAPWVEVLSQVMFHGRPASVEAIEEKLDPDGRPYLQWYAELFGLTVSEERQVPVHDEETRKRLFQHQLSRLFVNATADFSLREDEKEQHALSGTTPSKVKDGSPLVCVLFDDLHWFDTLSLELLGAVLNHLRRQRVFILAATRPQWEKRDFTGRGDCMFCPLAELDRAGTAELAAFLLGGKARDSLVRTIMEKTHGNPFFSRQYLLFLKQEDMLESRLGEWLMKRGVEEKADLSTSDILAAQVGRLSPQEQVLLKFAACMGPSFSLPVLKHAMASRFRKKALNGLLASGYLAPQIGSGPSHLAPGAGDPPYAFPHALIQEALYHSIPQRDRRRTHRKIALAMEALFRDSMEAIYPNLANHFLSAEIRNKSIEYSLKAGEYLYQTLSFPEACSYYEKAYGFLRFTSAGEKCRVGLFYAETLIRSGRLNECKSIAEAICRIAKRANFIDIYIRAWILAIDSMDRLSDYSFLQKTNRILATQKNNIKAKQSASLHFMLGLGNFRIGAYNSAEKHFRVCLRPPLAFQNEVIRSYKQLAVIECRRNHYGKAFSLLHKALVKASDSKSKYHEIRLNIEYANICIESGQLQKATEKFMDVLEQVECIGDYYLLANSYYNLGKLHLQRMELGLAEKYLNQSIEVCLNLGIINGRANGLLNLGIVRFYQKDYSSSYSYYSEAVQLFESIGEAPDICHGCYDLAEVCMVLGRKGEAVRWHAKGMGILAKIENPALLRQYMELAEQLGIKVKTVQ